MVANITNDISLLRQIREGNEDAFKSLFETYFTPLCRFIYLHLDDKNVAEELAMDIFLYRTNVGTFFCLAEVRILRIRK